MENTIAKDNHKELEDLNNNLQTSAKWFYWIAALSLINTLISFFDGNVSFIVGLGITQLIDGLVYDASANIKLIALLFEIGISAIFFTFGYYALKREKWAFLSGMVLYFLDGLIYLLVDDWLSIAFHGFVLFTLFSGLKSLRKIEAIEISQDGGLSHLEREISKA